MKAVVLSTTNPGKVREIQQIMKDLPLVLVPRDELGPSPQVAETGETYLENALLKARTLRELTGQPVIAEDSGLEVDALSGAPGVRSARYAGEEASDDENNAHLLRQLQEAGETTSPARYRCVAVFVAEDGTELVSTGTCEGAITTQARGSGGFGYDPLFIPDGYTVTMAELEPHEKDAISHRGAAIRDLAAKMQRYLAT